MTVFTVHPPREAAEAASETVFVPERFSWAAFFFAPFWFLWHRLWLVFFVWCAATVLLNLLHFAPLAKGTIGFLIALFCGLEAQQWRRRKLSSSGRPVTAVVSGETLEDAETIFFHRQDAGLPAPAPQAKPLPGSAPLYGTPAHDAPLGVFPEPEQRP